MTSHTFHLLILTFRHQQTKKHQKFRHIHFYKLQRPNLILSLDKFMMQSIYFYQTMMIWLIKKTKLSPSRHLHAHVEKDELPRQKKKKEKRQWNIPQLGVYMCVCCNFKG
jgi:hypothetical protein